MIYRYVLYWTLAYWTYQPCNDRRDSDTTTVYDLCKRITWEEHHKPFSRSDSAHALYALASSRIDSVSFKRDMQENKKIVSVRLDSTLIDTLSK